MPWIQEISKTKFRATYRDAAGKRHTKTWPTKTAAKTWALDQEAKVRDGSHRDPRSGRMKVREWWAHWAPTRVIEDNTRAAYDSQWRNHIEPRWGDERLDMIGTDDIEAWIAQMLADGVGTSTVRSAGALFLELLTSAATRRPSSLIAVNPGVGVKLPRAPRKTERFLDDAEYGRLLDGAVIDGETVDGFGEPWRTLVAFLCHTGLRWGEMAGLDVTNVDFLRRQVRVRGVLTETRGHFRFKSYPKSAAGWRTVPIPAEVVDMLAAHLKVRPAVALTLPDERGRSVTRTLLFTGLKGAPLARNWNARTWKPKVTALKLAAPTPTPHDMRHTFASWLVQDGVDLRVVQALLGHESITTTERYAHLAPDAGERAVKALEGRALRRSEPPAAAEPADG